MYTWCKSKCVACIWSILFRSALRRCRGAEDQIHISITDENTDYIWTLYFHLLLLLNAPENQCEWNPSEIRRCLPSLCGLVNCVLSAVNHTCTVAPQMASGNTEHVNRDAVICSWSFMLYVENYSLFPLKVSSYFSWCTGKKIWIVLHIFFRFV